ncbi:unnamed protein product [Camellia sinensis]
MASLPNMYIYMYIFFAFSFLKGEYLQLQDVNFAMESSRKSQIAFAAANTIMEEAQHREGITSIKRAQHREDIISVKRALDFSFQDVDELLRLVRLAMEAISR